VKQSKSELKTDYSLSLEIKLKRLGLFICVIASKLFGVNRKCSD